MPCQNDGIVRIEHGRLRGPGKKLVRIAHKILVKCILAAYEHHHGFLSLAPHAPAALHGGHNAARIPHQDADIQVSYVNAKLKGAGAHHSQKLARGHAGLNLPPLLRKIACPVCRNAVRHPLGLL